MTWWLLVAVFLLLWAGVALLLDAWMSRSQGRDLSTRLKPYQQGRIADEAAAWLRKSARD